MSKYPGFWQPLFVNSLLFCQAKSKSIQVNSNWIGRRWYYFRNFPTIYVAAAPIYVAACPPYMWLHAPHICGCMSRESTRESIPYNIDIMKRGQHHNDPQNFLMRKIFWPKNFLTGKIFWPENFFTQKIFLPENFWPEIFFDPKNFVTREILWPKNFVTQKISWHEISLTRKIF